MLKRMVTTAAGIALAAAGAVSLDTAPAHATQLYGDQWSVDRENQRGTSPLIVGCSFSDEEVHVATRSGGRLSVEKIRIIEGAQSIDNQIHARTYRQLRRASAPNTDGAQRIASCMTRHAAGVVTMVLTTRSGEKWALSRPFVSKYYAGWM